VRWLVRDHHDHPRIARAIVSLGEMNQQHLANDLYNAVVKMTAGSEVDIERWRTAFEAIPEPQRYARIGGRKRQRPITISEERERASREGKRRRKWKVQFLAEDKGDKIEAQVNGDRKRAWNRKEKVSKPRKRARFEEVHQDTFNLGSSGKGTDECETEVHPNCSPPHEVNLPLLGPSEENMEDKSECYDAADAISPADKLEPIPVVPAEQEVEEEPTSSLSEVTTLSSLQPSSPPCLSTPIPHQPDGFPSSPFIEVVSQITIITHAASEPDLRNITGAGNVSSSPCGVGKEAMLEQRRRWNSVGW